MVWALAEVGTAKSTNPTSRQILPAVLVIALALSTCFEITDAFSRGLVTRALDKLFWINYFFDHRFYYIVSPIY